MKKILVSHSSAPVMLSAASILEEGGQYRVVGWTAHPNATRQISERFPHAKVLDCYPLMHANVDHLCRELACEPDVSVLSPVMQTELANGRLTVSDCVLHRGAGTYAYSHQELINDVNSYFVIAQTLITELRPDLILFEVPPHAMYDIALEELARRAGIVCIVLVSTHMPGISKITSQYRPRFIPIVLPESLQSKCDDKRAIIRSCLNSAYTPFYLKPHYIKSESSYYRNRKQMRTLLVQSTKELIVYFVKKIFSSKKTSTYYYSYVKSIFSQLYTERGDCFHYAVNTIRGLLQERFYRQKCLKSLDGLTGKKIIFVPLSLQPEMSTLPAAGHMFNQLTYLKMLHCALRPYDDYVVLVKENPNQFSYPSGPQTRSIEFYRAILDMGFKLVDLDISSQKTIDMSDAIAVTTGTAGFEAAHVFRKPALCFAPGWYSEHPLALQINEYADLTLAIKKIYHNMAAPSDLETQVESFIEKFSIECLYLWPDAAAVEQEGFDPEPMAKNLAAAIDFHCSQIEKQYLHSRPLSADTR